MKARFTILFLLITFALQAQFRFEITPQYGYFLDSRAKSSLGELKVLSSNQYGLTTSFRLRDKLYGEFSWAHQDTEIKISSNFPTYRSGKDDLSVNHYQFGVIQAFGDDEELEPFAGGSMGWSSFDAKDQGYSTTFSFAIAAGVKYFFTNNIGIRVQSQLMLPVNWGSVYYGYGGATINTGSALLQLNFTGGLIFAFGDGENVTFD